MSQRPLIIFFGARYVLHVSWQHYEGAFAQEPGLESHGM